MGEQSGEDVDDASFDIWLVVSSHPFVHRLAVAACLPSLPSSIDHVITLPPN